MDIQASPQTLGNNPNDGPKSNDKNENEQE